MYPKTVVPVVFILILAFDCSSTDMSVVKHITNLLNTILDNYNNKYRPNFMGDPVTVQIDILVLNVGYVSEKDMEYSLDCYFRQSWYDDRLKFKGPANKSVLPLASNVLKKLWRPDTYIKNGRGSYLHTLTTPNILLRVTEEGEVKVSQRLTIKARCPMYLRKFPMDTQACPLILGSLGYNRRDLMYVWKKISLSDDITLSQYQIKNHITTERNISDIRNPEGPELSILQAHFVLERQQGYYLLQMYTPCSLIVVMSWVSFWINKEASPARVSLGIMTVLTMSALGLGGRDELPKVSYSTALDMYIVACFGFVFAALVEYAVVNFAHIVYIRKAVAQMRRCTTAGAIQQMRMMTTAMLGGQELPEPHSPEISDHSVGNKNEFIEQVELSPEKPTMEAFFENLCCHRRMKGGGKHGIMTAYTNIQEQARKKLKSDNPSKVVDKIDTISKFLFPILYFTFNALYWSAFLYWIPDEIDSIPSIRENLQAAEKK